MNKPDPHPDDDAAWTTWKIAGAAAVSLKTVMAAIDAGYLRCDPKTDRVPEADALRFIDAVLAEGDAQAMKLAPSPQHTRPWRLARRCGCNEDEVLAAIRANRLPAQAIEKYLFIAPADADRFAEAYAADHAKRRGRNAA